jgi:hypothetical protein
MSAFQLDLAHTLHVNRDTIVNVVEPRISIMATPLDGKVGAVALSQDFQRCGDILCGIWPHDARGMQSQLEEGIGCDCRIVHILLGEDNELGQDRSEGVACGSRGSIVCSTHADSEAGQEICLAVHLETRWKSDSGFD